MELRRVLTLRGPSVWARFPVLEGWLELTSPASPGVRFTDLEQRLRSCLPGLRLTPPATGEFSSDETEQALEVSAVVAQIALSLQVAEGACVAFSHVRRLETNVFQVVVEYETEEIGRAALEAAVVFCDAAMQGIPCDKAPHLAAIAEAARKSRPNPTVQAMIRLARDRGIPVRQLDDAGTLQLGYGARQRRIRGTITDRSPDLAANLARQESTLRLFLQTAGVPMADDTLPEGNRYHLLVVCGQVVAVAQVVAASQPGEANRSSGWIDVTAQVHRDVAERAIEATRILGLDVASVEVIARDIGASLESQGGVVVNVIPSPDLGIHISPTTNAPQRVAEAMLGMLFPADQNGRIPLVAVTGTNGKTTTVRLIAHILGIPGRKVGMTCTDGIYVHGRRVDIGDCSGPKSAKAVLLHPGVEGAVLETARGGILREGLGYDQADVGVVTNIGEGDHLGLHGIETTQQLARVKQVIAENVRPGGAVVLKADDPLTAGMAAAASAPVVFFALDGNHPVISRHRIAGGRAVFVREKSIVLADGATEIPLLSLDRVPLTHGGRVSFQVENTLAATAATWSLGIPAEVIRAGLETFAASIDKVPGRFNLMDVNGATVVFDYGHNPSSLVALLSALSQFPHGKRTCIYSAAGDRRDADMIRQGELLGEAFDRVILYEDHYMRGRESGAIMKLFKAGLAKGSRVKVVEEFQGWANSLQSALDAIQPGELLMVQADVIDETVEFVRNHLANKGVSREIGLNEAIRGGNEESPPAKDATAPSAKLEKPGN